jgi:hypothetical protein
MEAPPVTPGARRWRRLWPALIVGLAALVASARFIWPLFDTFWYQTHDMIAYPVRAIEYVAGWRSGAIWPRWAPDLYGGYGCALFNFYAPGLFIVSGTIMLLGASAVTALKLSLGLFTAVGVVGVFGAVWGESRRADAAAAAAAVFMFMAYHVTLVYVRGDLSEYSALCMAPMAVWAYRALGRARRSRLLPVGLAAAGAHAATLLIHTLTGQWLTEFIFLIAGVMAWQALRRGERWRALAIAVTFVGACGLTALYSIPALLERPLVHIERMTEGGFATAGNVIDFHWLTILGFFYMGKALLFVPVGALAVVARRRRVVADVIAWTLLAVVIVLAMLRFAAPIWSWLPFGAYIQFPWRLLGLASLFGALAWGAIWRELVPARAVVAWPLAILAILAVAHDGWRNRPPLATMTAAEVPPTAAQIARGMHSTVISDEYIPRTVPAKPAVPKGTFVLQTNGATVDLSLRSGTGFKLDLGGDAGATVDLRSFWFPGWQVSTRSGPAHATVECSPQGWVRLRLPKHGYYRVYVHFGLTPLRGAATAASVLSLIALIVLLRRLSRVGLQPPSSPA